MSQVALMAWVLAGIAAVAMLRVVLSNRGERAWRRAVLLVGQAALAGLLGCVLVPPLQPGQAGALLVLTEGADVDALKPTTDARIVSLPGWKPAQSGSTVSSFETFARPSVASAIPA